MIVILSGPAGAGKDSVLLKFQEINPDIEIKKIITTTSRTKRDYEIDGVHYNFIGLENFKQKIELGEFIEYEIVHGNYYGSTYVDLENMFNSSKNVIYVIDVKGAETIRSKLQDKYKIVSVFILPPSKEELIQRLVGRNTETPQTIKARLESMEYELTQQSKFDYLIINDNLDEAAQTFYDIIKDNQN